MDLDSVEKVKDAWYRLVGTNPDDAALTELGESEDDIAYQYLTRGCRKAQRYLLKQGYRGWHTRSSALSWSGTDAANGGQYTALPSDFLRAAGDERVSALREANGDPWGQQVDIRQGTLRGSGYYFKGDELWLTRGATPPTTLYLEYHTAHAAWTSVVTIDFPLEVRALIVAEGADAAMEENWLPGGREMEAKIDRALKRARLEAQDFARPTRQPRQFRKVRRVGGHY
jgi:hypothetical protein